MLKFLTNKKFIYTILMLVFVVVIALGYSVYYFLYKDSLVCAKKMYAFFPTANVVVTLDTACNNSEKIKGLTGRTSLGEFEGMIFLNEKEQMMSFWSKETSLPLDIAFFSQTGEVIEINELLPNSSVKVLSSFPSLMAMEVNKGFFAKYGIMPGDKMTFISAEAVSVFIAEMQKRKEEEDKYNLESQKELMLK